jgi:hypothetical protein
LHCNTHWRRKKRAQALLTAAKTSVNLPKNERVHLIAKAKGAFEIEETNKELSARCNVTGPAILGAR